MYPDITPDRFQPSWGVIGMSGFKRWFTDLPAIYGSTNPRGLTWSGRSRYRRDEQHREQTELDAWEGEGGNPAPRDTRLAPVFPAGATENPSFNARAN